MKILVVDDEKTLRWAAEKALKSHKFVVETACDGEEALNIFEKDIDIKLVILDIKMPGISGIEVLKKIKEIRSETFVIMISAFGDMETTIEAMKNGAYDFLLKPFDIETMISVVKKAIEAYKNIKNVARNTDKLQKSSIIGRSPRMQEIYKMIGKIAASDVTVLVTGESGAGKEVIARAVHYNSLRTDKPFLAINCTALQETLIESELFGHEKGSFTGAYTQKLGKFELANGGTVFLDEIGDMSPELQSKLLRVMEEKKFVRVGGTKEISIDIRIVSATNRNLEKAIVEGKFREDLYHRIKVIHIKLPPLRERKEDIPALVEYMLRTSTLKSNITYRISEKVMQRLIEYDWPGNVRELKNIIDSAIAISRDGTILSEHILISGDNQKKLISNKDINQIYDPWNEIENAISEVTKNMLEKLESENIEESELYDKVMGHIDRIFIEEIYNRLGKNQMKTSKILGINRNTLRSKLEKFNL
ncbi:MAG: sigma-54 dependent transcriptional regulator [Candidatus Muirbacterium halophilum]|nr:sigma-54 dependent transcriptional regulator [Candidatus Muirbacterium halophilum]MCK9474657.1 sigma-54 dependent transcriptional regulator [Candidatus Muirbacterium halophilum]